MADEVAVAWQGGEPTLMGLDFFRRAGTSLDGPRALHDAPHVGQPTSSPATSANTTPRDVPRSTERGR